MHAVLKSIHLSKIIVVIATVMTCIACTNAQPTSRLVQIKDRGFLTCGIWPEVTGFAAVNENGEFSGLEVDICRAVAAAIFGDPDKVKFTRAENVQQLKEDPDLDIVARRLTWSLTRAASNGLMFGPIVFYDGQGFLVPSKLNIDSIDQLSGRSICIQADENHASILAAFSLEQNLNLAIVPIENSKDIGKALETNRCAAYSADISLLGATRFDLGSKLGDFIILREMISKEPLAPIVRRGDDQFFEVLRWTIFALIAAEEFDVTSKNIDLNLESGSLEIRRLLGINPGNGAALGLSEDWAYNAIKSVGNYGEVFDRNVGRGSPIGLERGLNKLWNDGGLIYAPRLR